MNISFSSLNQFSFRDKTFSMGITKLLLVFATLSLASAALLVEKPSLDLLAPFESAQSAPKSQRITPRAAIQPVQFQFQRPLTKGFSFEKPAPKAFAFTQKPSPSVFSYTQKPSPSVFSYTQKPIQFARVAAPTFAPAIQKSYNTPYVGAQTLRSESNVNPDGSYQYVYQTDNGISAQEQGTPKQISGNPPQIAEQVQGGFAFTSPEGEQVSISYVADENGYQPTGSHLPTSPPIPDAILRAINYINSHSA